MHWSLYSQCGIWDPKGRGVDIWECIRARKLPLFFVSNNPHMSLLDDSTQFTQVRYQCCIVVSCNNLTFFSHQMVFIGATSPAGNQSVVL